MFIFIFVFLFCLKAGRVKLPVVKTAAYQRGEYFYLLNVGTLKAGDGIFTGWVFI